MHIFVHCATCIDREANLYWVRCQRQQQAQAGLQVYKSNGAQDSTFYRIYMLVFRVEISSDQIWNELTQIMIYEPEKVCSKVSEMSEKF